MRAEAGRRRAAGRPARCRTSSVRQHDIRVEIRLASHEAAGNPACLTRGDHVVETLARRAGDGHEHDVRLVALEQSLDRAEAADDLRAVEPAPAQRGGVVDETEHPLARRLAELAQKAAARAAGADDEDATQRAPAREL